MPDKKETATKIIFGKDAEVAERRKKARQFWNVPERNFLYSDEYEKCRNLVELMFAEGLPEDFIKETIQRKPDAAYAETMDFLHFAALVMGCDYVRQNILHRTVTLEDAVAGIRNEYQRQQIAPFREIYENLDEKISAALQGESKVNHQIELLQMQTRHAEAMYRQRIENAKTRFEYQLRLSGEKAKMREKLDAQQIQILTDRLKTVNEEDAGKISELTERLRQREEENQKLQEANKSLKEEILSLQENNLSLKKEIDEQKHQSGKGKGWSWPFGRGKEETQDIGSPGNPADVEPLSAEVETEKIDTTGDEHRDDSSEKQASGPPGILPEQGMQTGDCAESKTEPEKTPAEYRKSEERRDFCIRILRDKSYSEEQVAVLLALMMNENIPKETLAYICNPALPVYSMRALVKYLGGDNSDQNGEK